MAETVNLKKSYAALNEKVIQLFDEQGVKRSFTIPYIEGQGMDEHVASIGQAAAQAGGIPSNLILSAHHSSGKGWGTGEGHTVAHPAEKLRTTIIPKDDEHAKAAIAAAQKHIDNISFLLGEKNPAVQQAQSQLDLVKKSDAAGMSLFDFGTLLINMMYRPTQLVAQAHAKAQGHEGPKLQMHQEAAPEGGQETPAAAQGGPQGGGQAPEAQPAAPTAPAAPAAAPAPQQAQG